MSGELVLRRPSSRCPRLRPHGRSVCGGGDSAGVGAVEVRVSEQSYEDGLRAAALICRRHMDMYEPIINGYAPGLYQMLQYDSYRKCVVEIEAELAWRNL